MNTPEHLYKAILDHIIEALHAQRGPALQHNGCYYRTSDGRKKVNKADLEAVFKEFSPSTDPLAVEMQTLAAVLDGEILVHMHCYRADEMSLMMDLARTFGFRIRSFHHAVEAYKIADRLAERDVAASIWADWWGFKAEAYDGIRENAALLFAAGGRPIIHSDSAVGIQHLNQETAKAMYAGRRMGMTISDDDALRWMTANAAWALGQIGDASSRAALEAATADPSSIVRMTARTALRNLR